MLAVSVRFRVSLQAVSVGVELAFKQYRKQSDNEISTTYKV